MGRSARPKPARLAAKVTEVRSKLGLSQNEMIRHMGLEDELDRAEISAFERGIRVPPLHVLLKYAQSAGVYMEALVDDEVDLPRKLPCSPKSEGIRRRPVPSKSRR
jgi:transcriptional regulator with XRE-family HTH domain